MGQTISDERQSYLPPVDTTTSEFRLLKVLPAESIYDLLQCEYVVVRLEDKPKFAYLNTDWNDESNSPADHTVIIDNGGYHITRCLHDQLLWFRHLHGQGVDLDLPEGKKQVLIDQLPAVAPFRPSRAYFREYISQADTTEGYLCFTPRLCIDRSNMVEYERQNQWLSSRILAAALELFPEHHPLEENVKDFASELRHTYQSIHDYARTESRAVYEPLIDPANEIRVLQVQSLVNARDGCEKLAARLLPFRLQDAPPYTALSYAWGEPILDRTIILDGQEQPITANLAHALIRLRQHKEQYLWIDALCIDQKNLTEKSAQIPMMLDIYKRAEKVNIFLGEEIGNSNELDRVGAFMIKIVRSRELMSLGGELMARGEGLWSLGDEGDRRLRQCGFPPRSDAIWQACYRLLQRPWFRRAWIVREAAANDNTEVLMRGMVLSWNVLPAAIAFLAAVMGTTYIMHVNLSGAVDPDDPAHVEAWKVEMTQELAQRLLGRMQKFQERLKSGDAMHLPKLLRDCRYTLAANPRDKIYSVLGLSDCATRAPTPNYALSVQQVYHDYATFMVHDGHGMAMIEAAGSFRHSLADLPSWTPDWTFDREIISFSLNNAGYYNPPFSASGDSEPGISAAEKDGQLLEMEGGIIDRIVAIGTQLDYTGWEPWRRDFLQWDRGNRAILEHFDQHDREEYVRVLVADAALWGRKTDRLAQYTAIMEALQKPGVWQFDFLTVGQTDAWHDSGTAGAQTKSNSNIGQLIAEITNARAVCVTEKGRLGLVPGCAKVGDEICLFLGAPCPYVVRPIGKVRTLVGDAYVDGVMFDGIAMEDDDFIPDTITLQ